MKNVIRTCAIGVGVAAMLAASAFANNFQTERVSIPFQFHVAKVTLPAGEYKVQQVGAAGITFLVNVKTGQQVQLLRSPAGNIQTHVKLVFESTANGYTLKSIS